MGYTREEFQEISSWWDLRDFCYDYRIGTDYDNIDLDEIMDDDSVQSYVDDLSREYRWDDIYRAVADLYNSQWGEGLYYMDDGRIRTIDDCDIDEIKDQVLERFREEGNYFDDEEPEELEDNDDTASVGKYYGGVRSVYGMVNVPYCCEQSNVIGCSAEDFNKLFVC